MALHSIYVGRFAPSPSGPLHFGSLLAATGSYLDASAHGGLWRVRMEDLDPPREMPGAASDILNTLEACGFEWDGPVLYQSTRHAAYEAALEQLQHSGRLYPCACTRREIADSALQGIEGPVYPGTCRDGLHGRAARAWRVRTDNREIVFDDALQGRQCQVLARDTGDFVLKRADGLYAYQLAVVVDDAAQGITDVVRGADLLDSTPRQIFLQQLLGLPTPRYLHLPVVVNQDGEKLSKQTLAPAIDPQRAGALLWFALQALGQQPPQDLAAAPPSELWDWARTHWAVARIPPARSLHAMMPPS